jgi:nucleoside-diphosphate-sugar epimerase
MSEIITITGSSGFVGSNIIKYLKSFYSIKTLSLRYIDNQEIKIDSEFIIHLAGKAHDLKKVVNVQDYYNANYKLTKQLFDAFLISKSNIFIFISSVKAVADSTKENEILFENAKTDPQTHYGKSKLLAEKHILSKQLPEGKKIYILRPCMIHGPGNKGNLNLLYKLVIKRIPWPLGAFENKRSFCSIDNLCFIIGKLIVNKEIPSGIYNIADDEPLSTKEIITLISESNKKRSKIIAIPKKIIFLFAKLGDFFKLPLNNETLIKLTEDFIVSNLKIKTILNIKSLPISSKEGIIKTITNFKENN